MRKSKLLFLAGASLLAMTAPALAVTAIGSLVITALLSTGLGGLLPAVSAAAIGTAVLTGAAIAANIAFSFLGRRPSANPNDIKQTRKGAEGPGTYAFGRVRIAGKIGFGNTKGYRIYRLVFHCFGPLDGVEEYAYDGREIILEPNGDVSSPPWGYIGGSRLNVKSQVGDGSETAWSDLTTDFSSQWTSDHKARGVAQSLLKATSPGTGNALFPRLFQGGIKELELLARVGEFYDPRATSSAWTLNGVLHVLHFWRQLPGMSDAVIDFDDIEAVADSAEANVDTLTGTAPRCRLSGGWEGPINYDILQDMLDSAGLEIRLTDAGKYTLAFMEDDPDSEITFSSRHIIDRDYKAGDDGAKRPNMCRLKYFSPERQYEVAEIDLTDAPWAKVQAEIDAYGEQELPIDLVFCSDASQAQRIARRLFHMARADYGTIKTTFAGVAAWGLRTATIELPEIGTDGASVMKKCRLGPVRVYDEEGVCEIPFKVIPDILQTPWVPETDEVAAPPTLEPFLYESDLPTPDAPVSAMMVTLPSAVKQLRVAYSLPASSGATVVEAVYREVALAGAFLSMTEYGDPEGDGVATANIDKTGDPCEFKVRIWNGTEGSYFSDVLAATPANDSAVAPDDPTIEVTQVGSSNNVMVKVTQSPSIQATYVNITGSGAPGIVTLAPFQTYEFGPISVAPSTTETWYATAYNSAAVASSTVSDGFTAPGA